MNFTKLRDELARQAANRTVGAAYVKLAEGETRRFRFIGGDDEPFVIQSHYVKRAGPRGRAFTCYAHGPWARMFPGCPLCHHRADPGIDAPAPRYLFSVLSGRTVHPVTTNQGDKSVTQNYPCTMTDSGRCDACASGHKPCKEGRRYLELAPKHAQGIVAAEKTLGRRCAGCRGLGELQITGHQCSHCGTPVQMPPGPDGRPLADALLRCRACGQDVRAEASVRCSGGCEDARPLTLADCWVDVTRIGAGQSTTYSFAPVPPTPLTEEEGAVEPWDFAQIKAPMAPDDAATLCGVRNPWGAAPQAQGPGWPPQPPTGPGGSPPWAGGGGQGGAAVSAETIWGGGPDKG